MTDEEWQACGDPSAMLKRVRRRASDRKMRLFACACCRRIWDLLTDKRSRKAVELAEQFADGLVSEAELLAAHCGLPKHVGSVALDAVQWACLLVMSPYMRAVQAGTCAAWGARKRSPSAAHQDDAEDDEYEAHASLLRCIFNPSRRKPQLNPAWLAWNGGTVEKLAQMIYEERRFADLPILADALAEAGCGEEAVLSHCRAGGVHARGCWVLDWVLGRE